MVAQVLERALELAALGLETAAPNPVVGALIVRDGEIVGEGYHRAAGEPHAEALALRLAGERARGAELYVTLEPCNHTGRTPPCTEAVLASGVRRVVIFCLDPNPRVAGGGMARLREAGIEVERAPSELIERASLQNRFFLASAVNARPFVTLKYAMSLDGRIATHTGHSQWISSPESRARVHRERAEHQAILVGIGTALADDPELTSRLYPAVRQPLRIVLDNQARLPPGCRLLSGGGGQVLVSVGAEAEPCRVEALTAAGARVERGLDLTALLRRLDAEGVRSLLVEGGGEVAASLVRSGLVTRVLAYAAPILLGGRAAPGPLGGPGVDRVDEGWRLERLSARPSGPDLEIEGYLDTVWLQR